MNKPYCLGIDTWEGQLSIDEDVLKQNNVKFMFIRLNDINGGHHKDSNFDSQWKQAENFYRAPYFVFNPWKNGLDNFNWLAANTPPDAKAVGIDIEVKNPAVSAQWYSIEVSKFLSLVRGKWNYVIYTGEGYLPLLSTWEPRDYWWAEYPSLLYPSSTTTTTWQKFVALLETFTAPLNAAKCPGRIKFWQCTGDRFVLPGSTKPIDINVFFGDEVGLANFFGQIESQPSSDVISNPFSGIKQICGQRYGQNVYVNIIDPKQVKFQVINEYNLPSQICRNKGAQIAWNGDDWDRTTLEPKDNTEPSFLVFPDHVSIGKRTGLERYHSSGLRYLIQNGQNVIPVNGTETKYTEVHARSFIGIDTEGNVVHVTVDGDYVYKGITLYQGAEIMREFHAVTAFDCGGGGDSVEVINGTVVNVPDDETNGVHYERKVPQTILVFTQSNGGSVTTIKWKATTDAKAWASYSNGTFTNQAGTLIKSGTLVDGTKVDSTALHLSDGRYTKLAWFTQVTVTDPVPTPDPDPAPTDDLIEIYVNKVLKYSIEGKITIS